MRCGVIDTGGSTAANCLNWSCVMVTWRAEHPYSSCGIIRMPSEILTESIGGAVLHFLSTHWHGTILFPKMLLIWLKSRKIREVFVSCEVSAWFIILFLELMNPGKSLNLRLQAIRPSPSFLFPSLFLSLDSEALAVNLEVGRNNWMCCKGVELCSLKVQACPCTTSGVAGPAEHHVNALATVPSSWFTLACRLCLCFLLGIVHISYQWSQRQHKDFNEQSHVGQISITFLRCAQIFRELLYFRDYKVHLNVLPSLQSGVLCVCTEFQKL